MGLINNDKRYPKDTGISLKDKVIGSDDENNETKNYYIGDIYDFINHLNNKKSSPYQYSIIDADTKTGVFNITGNTFKFNEKDSRDIDNTSFFNKLKDNKELIVLYIALDVNDFSSFKITNISQNLNSFSFNLDPVGTTSVNDFLLDENYNLSIGIINNASSGGVNVQSDWDQVNNMQGDFIKNKPTTITASQSSQIAINTNKIGLSSEQVTTLSSTSNINTGDQDVSGITTNSDKITALENSQTAQDAKIASNTSKVSASGSVTSHSDVTNAGSGVIISNAERLKLSGLESSKFLGEFLTLTALNSAHPTASVGSYAYVDSGVGGKVGTYIWDNSDSKFEEQVSGSNAETPSSVKSKYEVNANTNAYTDIEKTKLSNIEEGAEVNTQANWNQSATGESDFIKNKPIIPVYQAGDFITIDNPNSENPTINGSSSGGAFDFVRDRTFRDLSSIYTIQGSYINQYNGTSVSNSVYERSDYEDCSEGEVFYVRMPDSDTGGVAFYNSSNIWVSGAQGKNKGNNKIFIQVPAGAVKFRICKKINEPTFILKYGVDSAMYVYFEREKLLSNPPFDLASELKTNDSVFLPSGTHIVNSSITNLTGKKIYGVRGKTFIKAGASLDKVFDFTNVTDCTLTGVEIIGTGSNIDFTDVSVIKNIDDALSEVGKGTKYGIYLENCRRINIIDCYIHNFDYCGVYGENIGTQYENGVNISNCFITHNYIGIKSNAAFEYSSFSDNHINNNKIGFINGSGNNDITGGSITRNIVGLIVNNLHVNNSHGNCTGTKLNHNTIMCLLVDSINVGFNFTAIQCHNSSDSNIYIRNSSGVVIANSTIKNGFTVKNGGGVAINSNCFRVAGQVISKIGLTYVKMTGNIYLNGSDNSGIND